MDNEEKLGVESKIIMVNEFRQHLFRALDIRSIISKDMILGVNLLQRDLSNDEGIRLLRRAVKNERPFLESVSKGLSKSNDFLFESFSWLSTISNDSVFLGNVERLMRVVGVFIDFFRASIKRFKAEIEFLDNISVESFEFFMNSWGVEIQRVRSLLNSINCSDLDSYFKNVCSVNRNIMRLSFGSDNFFKAVNDLGLSFKNNDEFSLYFSYCSLLGSISLMVLTFFELEKSIDDVNLDTLRSLNV
ncbi:hypothetical protein KO361_06095 [Candidatus Woesearchaeota archaeon]|nr:hypothetical protein [Candidatus Woesearchaeota archaeon]